MHYIQMNYYKEVCKFLLLMSIPTNTNQQKNTQIFHPTNTNQHKE